MSSDIIPIGGLSTAGEDPFFEWSQIVNRVFENDIPNAEAARECISDVGRLEDALKAAKQFKAYAKQFCLLEAQMWITISMLDDSDLRSHLSGSEFEKVTWIRSKNEQQLKDIIEECADGVRLGRIKARDTRAINRDRAAAEYNRIAEVITDELVTKGRTTVTTARFYKEWSCPVKPDPRQIESNVDKTRGDLLKRGGYGLGDGDGNYAIPSVCNRKEIAQIVVNRLRSIKVDLESILQICVEANFSVPSAGVNIIRNLLDKLEVA